MFGVFEFAKSVTWVEMVAILSYRVLIHLCLVCSAAVDVQLQSFLLFEFVFIVD
jgi:hypothetical protein